MANTYRTSSGERVKKKQIDLNVRKAKFKKLNSFMDEHGYIFCEGCKRSDTPPYDCSHDISVDECQKSGRSELAWDVDNITLLCRKCHAKKDKLNIKSAKL